MTCLCNAVPRDRQGQIISPQNKMVQMFHLDCEEHGITVLDDRAMKRVTRKAWVTPDQAAALRRKEGVKVIERSKDGRALVEWIEYQTAEEEELSGEG